MLFKVTRSSTEIKAVAELKEPKLTLLLELGKPDKSGRLEIKNFNLSSNSDLDFLDYSKFLKELNLQNIIENISKSIALQQNTNSSKLESFDPTARFLNSYTPKQPNQRMKLKDWVAIAAKYKEALDKKDKGLINNIHKELSNYFGISESAIRQLLRRARENDFISSFGQGRGYYPSGKTYRYLLAPELIEKEDTFAS